MHQQQSLRNFQVLMKLGEGSYAQVYKVERLSDHKIYAMKKVKMNSLKEKERENALNEVRILASINDPYIVAYKEAFVDEDSQVLCIIMEYANEGDLQQMIKAATKKGAFIPEPVIWRALYQMTRGLKKLHDMKIVHRDLKCANVFISDGAFKLGDLNVSKVAKAGLVHTQTGTPCNTVFVKKKDYASPEVWRDEPYDMRSDIWSLGCVAYEMASLKPPFRATDMQGLYNKVQKGIFESVPKSYSRDLQTILSSMIQLLNNPLLLRHLDDHAVLDQSVGQKNELLQTIQLPRNLRALKDQLPKSKYDNGDLNRSTSPIAPRGSKGRVQSALPLQKQAVKRNSESDYEQYPSAPRHRQPDPLQRHASNHNYNSLPTVERPAKLVSQPAINQAPFTPKQYPPSPTQGESMSRRAGTQKQEVKPALMEVMEVKQDVMKRETIQEIKQKSDVVRSEAEEPFNGLVVDGLHKINPMSIQSILCQPVLNVNEYPFPIQAKVVKKKPETPKQQPQPQPVAPIKKRPESAQITEQYQHYYPVSQQQVLYIERMRQNQLKSQQRIQEQSSTPNLTAKLDRITSSTKRQQSAQTIVKQKIVSQS